MGGKLQIVLALSSIAFLTMTIYFIRKKGLDLYRSLLWLFMAVLFLVLSLFPGIVSFFSRLMGIATASNAIFLIIIFFLLVVSLSMSAALSRHHMRIKRLVQSLALLERRVYMLEEEKKATQSEMPSGDARLGNTR